MIRDKFFSVVGITWLIFVYSYTQNELQTEPSTNNDVYAVAHLPTPVLYDHNFSEVFGGLDGRTLKLDGYEEIDELEFIAFPDTVFRIIEKIHKQDILIYKVTTDEYSCGSDTDCYVDSRFVTTTNQRPSERNCEYLSKSEIISNLKSMNGGIYTWGGNYSQGIPEILEFYPPNGNITTDLEKQWTLTGNDCSGLIYEATNGCIPRNTSELVYFGEEVQVKGKSQEEVFDVLEPLDLIVWKGHNAIVIDDENVIEANIDFEHAVEGFQGGVKIRPIKDFLEDTRTIQERIPYDDYDLAVSEGFSPYVVRRWHKEI